MADADQAIACKRLAHIRHQMLERAGVAKLGALAPGLLGGQLASAILRDEVRRGVDAFDLAAQLRARVRLPRTRKSENLMLEEPALRTAMASAMRAVTRDS